MGISKTINRKFISSSYGMSQDRVNEFRVFLVWYRLMKLSKERKSKNEPAGICERWYDFDNFLDDVYSGYSRDDVLVKLMNCRDFSKENCRWISRGDYSEARRERLNNSNNYEIFEFENRQYTLKGLSERYNIKTYSIRVGLGKNLTIDEVIKKTRQYKRELKIKNEELKIFKLTMD